jgi:exodeoxyribonuclease III
MMLRVFIRGKVLFDVIIKNESASHFTKIMTTVTKCCANVFMKKRKKMNDVLFYSSFNSMDLRGKYSRNNREVGYEIIRSVRGSILRHFSEYSDSSSSSTSSSRSNDSNDDNNNDIDNNNNNRNSLRVVSWNTNGMRATQKENPNVFVDLALKAGNAQVLCIQETKLQEQNVDEKLIESIGECFRERAFSSSTARKGYSGVAIFSTVAFVAEPIEGFIEGAFDRASFDKTNKENVDAFDSFAKEGRVLTCEFERAFVVNVYVPNSGEGLKRLRERIDVWEPAIKAHIELLRIKSNNKKAIIWTGDFNVAHTEQDLWGNWKQNEQSAGFTKIERETFSTQLSQLGFVDSFRLKFPDAKETFSYWSYRQNARERNRGWRIDYGLVDMSVPKEKIIDAFVLDSFLGSDHCPIGVEIVT